MTGVMEIPKKPSKINKGICNNPLLKMKRSIKIGVATNEITNIRRRPKRSLSDPDKKAPTTPAASRMDNEAPATHRLAPSVVKICRHKCG